MRLCDSVFKQITNKGNADNDFIEVGMDILNDEALTHTAYEAMLSLLCKSFVGTDRRHARVGDIGMMYLDGIYMPGASRIVLLGEAQWIDLEHGYGNLYLPEDRGGFFRLQKIDKLPRGVVCPVSGRPVKLTSATSDGDKMTFENDFYHIRNAGQVAYAFPSDMIRDARYAAGKITRAAAIIGAIADSRHLWSATVEENLIGAGNTRLRIGLEAEQIKSVLYARTLPLTESGRKRPILHLVRAHQRRIKEGVDIDISRHIRGIDNVSIDGMTFALRPPAKDIDLHRRWIEK
ncbi:hypothetical protein [Azorhizophilus paspali]|uniref:hypothetical protein n=1 Tax=Azorhizophilus paspali TaxID=69963 RepID=UPI0037493F17